jgi:hypothetical protein
MCGTPRLKGAQLGLNYIWPLPVDLTVPRLSSSSHRVEGGAPAHNAPLPRLIHFIQMRSAELLLLKCMLTGNDV